MGQGVDLSTTYMRGNEDEFLKVGNSSDIPKKYLPIFPSIHINKAYSENSFKNLALFSTFIIYFCGKMYRGVGVSIGSYTYGGTFHRRTTQDKHFYTSESLFRFLKYQDIHYISLRRSILAPIPRGMSTAEFSRRQVEEFLEGTHDDRSFVSSMISQKQIILSANARINEYGNEVFSLKSNPKLENFEFYRVHPAPQAYQEIEMYISGVLGQANREPINISDKDRIYQHGFNERSFRKDPDPSKKRNRGKA